MPAPVIIASQPQPAFAPYVPLPCHAVHRSPPACPKRLFRAPRAARTTPSPAKPPPSPPPSSSSPEPQSPPLRENVATSCGFATLLGPSNSGKSTLLNRLVGQKVAIVTPKVQTTRCRVAGIATFAETQVVFVDTPGIFDATTRLSRAMVKSAWKSGREADLVAIVLDAAKLHKRSLRRNHRPVTRTDNAVTAPDDELAALFHGVQRARQRGRIPCVCVVANKMDVVPESKHEAVRGHIAELLETHQLSREDTPLFTISARRGDHVAEFTDWVVKKMPRGPWLYADDDMTDMPMRQLAAEVVREKAFMALRDELPYQIAVDTTSFRTLADGSFRVELDILVARDSQKRIVTGQAGSVVKKIGMTARKELAEMLGATVHMMLKVKVRPKWKEEKWHYEQWGLDFNA